MWKRLEWDVKLWKWRAEGNDAVLQACEPRLYRAAFHGSIEHDSTAGILYEYRLTSLITTSDRN